MSSRVISVIQLSPATGKSTVATNLAGELARFNRVGLVDCDTLTARAAVWGTMRQEEAYSARLIVKRASTPGALLERVYELRNDTDYTILDGTADTAVASAMVAVSHLCLMPMDCSQADHADVGHAAGFVRETSALRKVRMRVVRNRCLADPSLPSGVADLRETVGVKILRAALTGRPAYQEALDTGRTGAETKDPIARDEVHSLVMAVKSLFRRATATDDKWQSTITQVDLNPRTLLHLTG